MAVVAGIDFGTLSVRVSADGHSTLGTIRQPDGRRHVTYAGKPLYDDFGDGRQDRCCARTSASSGGLWLVVRPDGSLVR